MPLHRKFSHASITSAQIPSCVHLPCCSGASDVLVALILVELGGHGQNLLQCQPRSVNILLQLDDLPLLPPIPPTHQQPPILHLLRARDKNIQRWITRWNADRAIYKNTLSKFQTPAHRPTQHSLGSAAVLNFTSSWDFVIFREYWISRSRCNIWCSVRAQGWHQKT